MGNLIAVLSHCQRGDEVILGDQAHTFLYEAGGISSFGGVHSRQLVNQADGTILIDDIKNAITKIEIIGRLQEIKSGKIKDLIKNNRLLLDGSHNEDGARVLNEYLQTLDCNKHFIIGMMSNKNHEEYISHFKDISSLTTVDIPNQQNAISGKKLKEKFQNVFNAKYEVNVEKAIKSLSLKENDMLIITGSLYLAGEILNLN